MKELPIKGKIIGFEQYEHYVLKDFFGESSPFRILSCSEVQLSFLVLDPFHVAADYSFELDDALAEELGFGKGLNGDIAIFCIVKLGSEMSCVNLRSPLVINTRQGIFKQIILPNETYPVSAPFMVRKAQD